MITGIYAIKSPSGNQYIGQAADIEARWNQHIKMLKGNRHHNPGLQGAFHKYGVDNLKLIVIEETNKDSLTIREQFHIDSFKWSTLYNSARTAQSMRGFKHSEATKKFMSESRKGHETSEVTKDKISKSLMGRKRQPHSEESKLKISLANTGKTFSEDHRRQISERMVGIPKSSSTRAKISAALSGSNSPFAKRVRCTSNGIEFNSVSEACKWLVSIGNVNAKPSSISNAACGRRPTCYGFEWEYI